MVEMRHGDLVEIWETVSGSDYVRLLREAHEYDPKGDPPRAFIETVPPHRTYRFASYNTVTDEAGNTVHRVLVKLQG